MGGGRGPGPSGSELHSLVEGKLIGPADRPDLMVDEHDSGVIDAKCALAHPAGQYGA